MSPFPYGTPRIQIDVVAADCKRRLLAIAECKEFLSFQGASECAEQITLKTYLLRNFLKGALGACPTDDLAEYDVDQYVSLGSRMGSGYANVKARADAELEIRRDAYSTYLNTIGRNHLGIFLFRNEQTVPITKPATVWKWYVRAGSTPGGGANKMTIHIKPPSLADRLLSRLGKKRAVFIPAADKPFGYYIAPRESFVRALLRPANRQPPKGWIYWDDIMNSDKEKKSE